MARTKQTARKTTGGKAPRKQLAMGRKSDSDSGDDEHDATSHAKRRESNSYAKTARKPSQKPLRSTSITVYAVEETYEHNYYHPTKESCDETESLYSTLKAANRAAIRAAREQVKSEGDEEEVLGFVGHWNHTRPFSAEKHISKYEMWNISVRRRTIDVYGPDLNQGDVDSASDSSESDEDESVQDMTDEGDGQDTQPASSSPQRSPSVEIIEVMPASKKQRIA